MNNERPDLDTLWVENPCPASWDAMTGDERARFCQECQRTVHDLSAMSRKEAEALVRKKDGDGHICVRFSRAADGTVRTADAPSPEKPQSVLREMGWKSARLVVAIMLLLFATATIFLGLEADSNSPGESSKRSRDSWFRRHEPFKSVLNHVDPPKEERLMGKVCPPESRP
jgi:hypothetical protein